MPVNCSDCGNLIPVNAPAVVETLVGITEDDDYIRSEDLSIKHIDCKTPNKLD